MIIEPTKNAPRHIAVELQKRGLSVHQIAEQLSVSVGVITAWWRIEHYSPIEYHAQAIYDAVSAGSTMGNALRLAGLSSTGGKWPQVCAILGLPEQKQPSRHVPFIPRHPVPKPVGEFCQLCGIAVCKPEDADKEQESTGAITDDGLVCRVCAGWIERGVYKAPTVAETGAAAS